MYGNNYYQPYMGSQRPMYQQPIQQQMSMPQPQIEQQQNNISQFQPQIKQGLLGEVVESLDVVKALSYPLNGSVSYFPTSDGTRIFTKQLQLDGSVKISTYMLEQPKEETIEQPKYATKEDIESIFKKLDFRADIDEIKKALKKDNKKDEK